MPRIQAAKVGVPLRRSVPSRRVLPERFREQRRELVDGLRDIGELQGPDLQAIVVAERRDQIPHELPLPVRDEEDAPAKPAARRGCAAFFCCPPTHRGATEAVQLGGAPSPQGARRVSQEGAAAAARNGAAAPRSDVLLAARDGSLDESSGVTITPFRVQLSARRAPRRRPQACRRRRRPDRRFRRAGRGVGPFVRSAVAPARSAPP